MKIKELMTKSVCYIEPVMKLKDAAKLMRDKDVGILPVASNDRLVGMLTDRDIVIHALVDGKSDATAADAMTKKVLYCMEEDSVEDVAKNLGKNQVRRMPVLNKDKRLVGIISLGDLARKCSKDINIVGDSLHDICMPAPTSGA